MAKFNTYGFKAENADGNTIAQAQVVALSMESAWMKAVASAFDAAEPGEWPESINVYRIKSPSESHG